MCAMIACSSEEGDDSKSENNSTSQAQSSETNTTQQTNQTQRDIQINSSHHPTPQHKIDRLLLLKTKIGEQIFHDKRLSASGQMSCASCHISDFAHTDKTSKGLPLGGPHLDQLGMRSTPSIRYLQNTPSFSIMADGTPIGGFFWDGRANSFAIQAQGPFFNPIEMALPGSADKPEALTHLIRQAPYYPFIQAIYRPWEINTEQKLFTKVTELLETYQRNDPQFSLFNSKFDLVLQHKRRFTPSEARGWASFNDPKRGNCAACHTSEGAQPLFTNFQYFALAAPRNYDIPNNQNTAFFDLGLCARNKTNDIGIAGNPKYCGLFKTPTLRNISKTAPYFHNGSIKTLEDAVRFYFERDHQPNKWFVKKTGEPDGIYNDLPPVYWNNIARGLPPFDGSWQPTNQDIADLVAFLKTLDDQPAFLKKHH